MEKMFVLLLLGFGSIIYAQNANEFPVIKGDYFGQIPPCDTPVVICPAESSRTVTSNMVLLRFLPTATKCSGRQTKGLQTIMKSG